MIDINKVQNITDMIHGTIQCSGIEKEIISTPIFNRLHRILQNSLVYLTFPSNKVKRFEHSIGTMHLAGEIFYNSIVNADYRTVEKFLNEIKYELDKWYENISEQNFQFLKSTCFDNVAGELKQPKIIPLTNSRLYSKYIPYNIQREHINYYLVTFQAVRIAGLLHDIGHLPYSHVLEKASAGLFEKINSKSKDEQNDNEKEYIKTIRTYYTNEKGKEIPIHEILSMQLFEKIERCIYRECGSNNTGVYCLVPMAFYIAKRIIGSTAQINDIYSDMHSIIAGTFDADRLDYCCRDVVCSGVHNGVIDYERLLNTFVLGNVKFAIDTPEDRVRFVFAPSLKMVKEIEDLIYRRWRIYSDINYHHNVHKTERLMTEVVIQLGEDALQVPSTNNVHENDNYLLPMDISGLWYLIGLFATQKCNEALEYVIIQLDDSWLDTVLKRLFISRFSKPFSEADNKNDILWNRLNELCSAKKRYISIIKNNEDYSAFDQALFTYMQKQDAFQHIIELCNDCNAVKHENSDKDNIIPNKIKEFVSSVLNGCYEPYRFDVNGLTYNIYEFLLVNALKERDFTRRINERIQSDTIRLDPKIKDCIVSSVSFATGIDSKSPLYLHYKAKKTEVSYECEFTSFSEVSSIVKRLHNEKMFNISLHIYVCCEGKVCKETILNTAAKAASEVIIEVLVEYMVRIKTHINEHVKNLKIETDHSANTDNNG